ncbi:MAG: GHKL domain-containing protein [Oscillospiraceae bacterium]
MQQIIISVVLFYIIFAAVEAAFEAIYHVQEIKDSLAVNPTNQFTYLIIVTFAKTVSLVIVKIINRFGTTNTIRMPLPQFLGFLLLPLASFIVLGMLVASARADRLNQAEDFWIVAGCLGLLISNLVIFYLFDRAMEAMERNREYEVASLQYEYESRELRRLSEYNERNRKLHHDLEHYLSTISALSSQRDFEGIGRVIHSVDGRIKDAKQRVYCQNSIVNSVFSLKHEEAERLGIDFQVEVVPVMELSHIDDGDMCVLLSNVLSNAVEAAAKCEGDRFVDVGVFPVAENKAIVIRVRNSYTGKLNTDSDGRLISSKKNRSRHGFGLTNVGEVVDKYSGTYYYETAETDKVFITHIMLNMLR